MTKSELRQRLKSCGNENLKKFSERLIDTRYEIIGLAVPYLRSFAKELAKENAFELLDDFQSESYEETCLYGYLVGEYKGDISRLKEYLTAYIPYIDNWSTCDTVVSSLKLIKKYRDEFMPFIEKYIRSDKEFEIRFAVVCLMDHYLIDGYFDKAVETVKLADTSEYYASMAVSWFIQTLFVKSKERAELLLTERVFDERTHNKAIRKICDSFRVTDEDKTEIKKLLI